MTINFDSKRNSQAANSSNATSRSYAEGIIAGVIGATVIAVWFLILDFIQGRPLYTPTVLGTALFGGENRLTGRDPFHASWETTLMFTWVHGLAFILIGGIASLLLGLAERNPNLGFGILLLFVILEFGFVAVAIVIAEPILGLLAWPAVLVGNVLAASAMAGYFWYRHGGITILP